MKPPRLVLLLPTLMFLHVALPMGAVRWARAQEDAAEARRVALFGRITLLDQEDPGGGQQPGEGDEESGKPSGADSLRTVSFELKTRRDKLTVDCSASPRVLVCEALRMKDAPESSPVWILGAVQAKTRTEDDRDFPAQVIKINAIVIAESPGLFTPPAVPEELVKQRVQWGYGTLYNMGTRFAYSQVGGESINMQVGADRPIVRIKLGELSDLKRKDQVFVSGEQQPLGERLSVRASQVWRLSKELVARELPFVLGPELPLLAAR